MGPLIERTTQWTNQSLEEMLVDSGYPSGQDLAECDQRGVVVDAPWNQNAFTQAKRAKAAGKEQIKSDQFSFDLSIPGYRCPQGKVLRYRKPTSRQKANGEYLPLGLYQADPSDCAGCPLKAGCLPSRSGARSVRRHEHQELIDALKERLKTAEGKKKYRDRGCTVERRFADAKGQGGLWRFSGRTPERADAQLDLTVLADNLRTLRKLQLRNKQAWRNPTL